jgi:hypothetical protein
MCWPTQHSATLGRPWNFLESTGRLINTWLQPGVSARHPGKPFKLLSFLACRYTALKRGVNEDRPVAFICKLGAYKSPRSLSRAIVSRIMRWPK